MKCDADKTDNDVINEQNDGADLDSVESANGKTRRIAARNADLIRRLTVN